ncbi:MAG TPA: universal stress protein [Vicinamibacterales bacterium]
MNVLPRRILVPVEFERASRRAVRYARALASVSRGEICLLHVMPGPAATPATENERWWRSLAERTLSGLAERMRLAPGTETCVLSGPVAPTIGRYAEDHDFDLIVVSGRREPDWHGSLLGSTATAILRHSRVPVLVVPTCAKRETRPDDQTAEPVEAAVALRAVERRRT